MLTMARAAGLFLQTWIKALSFTSTRVNPNFKHPKLLGCFFYVPSTV